MTTTSSAYRREQQISSVRLLSNSNVSGTYYNGAGNNGVGATLTIAASTLTIDSVACANNDRVLLQNQSSGYQNGIYVVSGIGSAVVLTRSYDFQTFDQMKPGYFVSVEAGTVFGGAMFGIVEPQVGVVGTDSILFVDASASPTTVTLANNGLRVLDTNASHYLQITPGSDLSANRIFTLVTGDAARTLTMTGDATVNQNVSSTGSPTFADPVVSSTVTIPNSGLHILDTNASHDLVITPGSDLTADRILTITTGDAARTLDISAGSVTVSAFGASLVDDAAASNARTTLGFIAGTTAAYAGGGTSNAFAATGLTVNSKVSAVIRASTNDVAIAKALPGTDTLTVTFTADPGAATTVDYIAVG